MTLDDLKLDPMARAAAIMLRERYPGVIFTSGQRSLLQQAHAMARNVMRNRQWIGHTYTRKDRPSYAIAKHLQAWVDAHGEALDEDSLMGGLYAELVTDPRGPFISMHCIRPLARAFDVEPLVDAHGLATADGWRLIEAMRGLPYSDVGMPLLREGGLIIWHWQAHPDAELSVKI